MEPGITVIADRLFDGTRFIEEGLQVEVSGDFMSRIRGFDPQGLTGRIVIDTRGAPVIP
jgi:hypothetical protein